MVGVGYIVFAPRAPEERGGGRKWWSPSVTPSRRCQPRHILYAQYRCCGCCGYIVFAPGAPGARGEGRKCGESKEASGSHQSIRCRVLVSLGVGCIVWFSLSVGYRLSRFRCRESSASTRRGEEVQSDEGGVGYIVSAPGAPRAHGKGGKCGETKEVGGSHRCRAYDSTCRV